MNEISSNTPKTMAEVQKLINPYRHPNTRKALWQLTNTLLPYAGLLVLMYFSLSISYVLTLLLSIVAALFLIRVFIIFHDCGHQSFFPSRKANQIVGFFLGLLTFTPSEQWWRSHAIHHSTNGNLDKRGVGDVETMTVEEYVNSPLIKKISYRVFRYPPVMFGIGPIFVFIIKDRFPVFKLGKKAAWSAILADIVLAGFIYLMSLTIGLRAYILVQLPVIWMAGAFGIWLFYVQHQFDGMYWKRDADWNYIDSALHGASFYKLPKILQWFSGNIGFHNIHHLSPRIPNYELEACYKANPHLSDEAATITLKSSFRSLKLALWDEKQSKMIGFHELGQAVQA